MYLPTTKLDTRKGVSAGLVENASPEKKNAVTIEGFARRVLTQCGMALKNRFRHSKVHYYHISDLGSYFFLEESHDFADEVYITSCKSLVEPADLIKIEYVSAVKTYRIIELQSYSNAPDICVARLRELPSDFEMGNA